MDDPDNTKLVIQSVWEMWDDLENHKNSALAEQKALTEFAPHISQEALRTSSQGSYGIIRQWNVVCRLRYGCRADAITCCLDFFLGEETKQ